MSQINSARSGCKDVFHAFLVENATYDGFLEIPTIEFAGVITPDFSLYRDMPLVMQFWNIYRNRSVGNWLQKNGINVIANVRYSDSRTYIASCLGVAKHGTIAVGSHGCIKCKNDRQEFIEGLDFVVTILEPKVIVVFGAAPDYIFNKYRNMDIEILQFESDFSLSRKENRYGSR